MSQWLSEIIEEQVSLKHREAVFEAAQGLLSKNQIQKRRGFLKIAIGVGAALSASFVALFLNRKVMDGGPGKNLGFLAHDSDMLKNIELFEDLEMIKELETLEKWEPS